MTVLLPPGTNRQYHGSRYSAWFLALYSIGWILPGMIHSFLPDGGAGTIAGLDLSHNRRLILVSPLDYSPRLQSGRASAV